MILILRNHDPRPREMAALEIILGEADILKLEVVCMTK